MAVAAAGRSLFVWAEGDPYSGRRPRASVPLTLHQLVAPYHRASARHDDLRATTSSMTPHLNLARCSMSNPIVVR